jgi:hypothetical protein
LDAATQQPVPNFSIEILNISPSRKITVQDSSGNFELSEVPMGRYRLLVQSPNRYDQLVPNVIVQGGQETDLEIQLDERVESKQEELKPVEVSSTRRLLLRNEAKNVLSSVGVISFTLEEVNRFSGSRSDIARLVTGSAGMINSDDARNDLTVRGVSPLGVAWRIEGLPILNPNHLGYMSTTAGYFPLININMMNNSDYLLGNFTAEYGNSTAGTFDLNFRPGNHKQRNYLGQFSLNGLEFMAEGPLQKGKSASYLVAARYSLLEYLTLIPSIRQQIGVAPTYGDLNFNIHSGRATKSEWNFFGLFGFARAYFPRESLDEENVAVSESNKDLLASNRNAMLGFRYRYYLNPKQYWQVSLGSNYAHERNYADYYYLGADSTEIKYRGIDYRILNWNQTLYSYLNTKVNSQLHWRAGLELQYQFYDLNESYDRYNQLQDSALMLRHDSRGSMVLARAFGQLNYRLNTQWLFQMGLSGMVQSLNADWALDPSLIASWQPNAAHRLSLGYALQQQQLPQRIYFFLIARRDSQGNFLAHDRLHEKLKFLGNHYLNLEYLWQLSEYWQLRFSPYAQWWFNLPIDAERQSGYSLFNSYSRLPDEMPEFPLRSAGQARNYGLDLSMHRSFKNGFYLLLAGSYFNSYYQGSDGEWRNSLFNRNYILRLRSSKEFNVGKLKSSVFFLSTTLTFAGGEWYTPIDLDASRLNQLNVNTNEWHSKRTPYYLRWDLKMGMRINSKRRKITHYWYLDLMNLSNHRNILRYQYVRERNDIIPIYQLGILPDLLYRVQF